MSTTGGSHPREIIYWSRKKWGEVSIGRSLRGKNLTRDRKVMKQPHVLRWLDWSRPTTLVVGIIGLALGLRVWGIWFGLPYIFHNDEDLEVVRALQLGSGSFDFQRIYKGGYFYLLFFEYGILFVVLKIIGVVDSAVEFAEYYFRDPSAFYLIGRGTTALIGTTNVYLMYRLGQLAYSAQTGLIAASLLAVNVLHAKLSHYTTVDIPLTCLSTASLYFAIKIAMNGDRRDYIWAAVLAALATTTKVSAILLVIPLCLSHYFNIASQGAGLRRYFLAKPLWQAIAAFVVIYTITTPGIVINFGQFAAFMLRKFGIGDSASSSIASDVIAQESMYANTNMFGFYFDALKDSMTWPVFLICLAGVSYGLWRRKRADLILISTVATFYFILSMTADTKEFFPRYILPAIPALALLGARFLAKLPGYFRIKRKERVAISLVTMLAILPVSRIVADNALLTNEDTRAIAVQWFESNIPAGSRVFIEGTRTRVSESTVPLQNSPDNVRRMIEYYRDTEPGKAKYFAIAIKSIEEPSYDLVLVSKSDLQDLAYYKEAGVEYFVIRPGRYEGSRRSYEWPKIVEQLRSDSEASMVKSFDPSPETADGPYRGPYIEIFRVNQNTE
jgi:4-amino-4-deoxy-L-arabinose transferase-like glycosyltransferase